MTLKSNPQYHLAEIARLIGNVAQCNKKDYIASRWTNFGRVLHSITAEASPSESS